MNLGKKKILAAKTLGVGLGRIIFNNERLAEIKEAITKQDIKDLYRDGAISVREIKGQRKIERRKLRRRPGSIKKKIRNRKRSYMMITRKSRAYIGQLRKQGKLSTEDFMLLRKEIRARMFKDRVHLKERIKSLGKGAE